MTNRWVIVAALGCSVAVAVGLDDWSTQALYTLQNKLVDDQRSAISEQSDTVRRQSLAIDEAKSALDQLKDAMNAQDVTITTQRATIDDLKVEDDYYKNVAVKQDKILSAHHLNDPQP